MSECVFAFQQLGRAISCVDYGMVICLTAQFRGALVLISQDRSDLISMLAVCTS